jgi:virginiamycin B lyase
MTIVRALAVFCLALLVAGVSRAAAQPTVTEFLIPTESSQPTGIAYGPEVPTPSIWFTEEFPPKIGRLTGLFITEFDVPTPSANPVSITLGPDGNLWFTELDGNQIGRITPSGQITEFPIPTGGAKPRGITAGPDGNLWFTEQCSNKIGRITPTGQITEFDIPSTGGTNACPTPAHTSLPWGITTGPDGNLWFTERAGNKIGRITPAGQLTEFSIPSAGSNPTGIVAASDGNLWFTETGVPVAPTPGRIATITPAGQITEFPEQSFPTQPLDIGIAGAAPTELWFTETATHAVARMTLMGNVTRFTIPGAPLGTPSAITKVNGAQVWFTEVGVAAIGRVDRAGGGNCTGFRIGPTQTDAGPQPVSSTETVRIVSGICSGRPASNFLVDLEIYDAGGNQVAQRVFQNQAFASAGTRFYPWAFDLGGLPSGEYTVKVGIFSHDWTQLFAWDNNAARFTVGTAPANCTGSLAIGPSTATPNPVSPGETERAQTRVCSPAAGTFLIDLEIHNADGQKIAQKVFPAQSFAAGEVKEYAWDYAVPSLTAGPYTLKVGVFATDWSVLYAWANQTATFAVASGPPCTGGFRVGPSSATPAPVARAGTESIQTQVCSGSAATVLVDLEIYNAGGQKIAQNVFTGQSFTAGQTRAFTWNYAVSPALATGTYTVKVGVFSNDWSSLHAWDNQAATFVVQ